MKNGEPSRLLSGTSCGVAGTGRCGIGRSPSAAASSLVKTAITPAVCSALAASMRRIRACACGERTMQA